MYSPHGNPLQCSCLENPRDGGAWWAAIYGVAQSQTRLKQLSSSSILPKLDQLQLECACNFLFSFANQKSPTHFMSHFTCLLSPTSFPDRLQSSVQFISPSVKLVTLYSSYTFLFLKLSTLTTWAVSVLNTSVFLTLTLVDILFTLMNKTKAKQGKCMLELYLLVFNDISDFFLFCFLVVKSCLIFCDPMDCSPAGSSVHGISQARIVMLNATSQSRGSS